jgi:hypothetical protein
MDCAAWGMFKKSLDPGVGNPFLFPVSNPEKGDEIYL